MKPFVFVCSVCCQEKRSHVGKPRKVNGAPVCASCVCEPHATPAPALPMPNSCVRAIETHEASPPAFDLAELLSMSIKTLSNMDPHERRRYRGKLLAT